MKDGTVAMGECKARLQQVTIDFIKEAELHRVGSSSPDGKIGTLLSKSCAQISWVGRFHPSTLRD